LCADETFKTLDVSDRYKQVSDVDAKKNEDHRNKQIPTDRPTSISSNILKIDSNGPQTPSKNYVDPQNKNSNNKSAINTNNSNSNKSIINKKFKAINVMKEDPNTNTNTITMANVAPFIMNPVYLK